MDKALVIQSNSGEHFGFILFSGEPPSGDCIFQLLPQHAGAFEDPAFQFLESYGFRVSGEHRWERLGKTISLALSTGGMATVELQDGKLIFDTGHEYRVKGVKGDEGITK